jgi:hypothetical protein
MRRLSRQTPFYEGKPGDAKSGYTLIIEAPSLYPSPRRLALASLPRKDATSGGGYGGVEGTVLHGTILKLERIACNGGPSPLAGEGGAQWAPGEGGLGSLEPENRSGGFCWRANHKDLA